MQKKKRKRMKGQGQCGTGMAVLLVLVITASLVSAPAFSSADTDTPAGAVISRAAAEVIAEAADDTGTVTLQYVLSDCDFFLYYVADYSESGSYTPAERFDELPVDWSSLDEEAWYDMAKTLQLTIAGEEMEADQTAKTDEDGTAVFAGLQTGLYLILGSQMQSDGYLYTVTPILMLVTDTVEIEITKYSKEEVPETVDVSVQKVWSGDEKDDRPSQITVNLLQDGEVYDSVTLDTDNNWAASWSNLDGAFSWTIAESEVPDGYLVSYDQDGYTFVIVNTFEEETKESETPDGSPESTTSEEASGSESPEPDASENASGSETPSSTDGAAASPMPDTSSTSSSGGSTTLPQTGMLVLPVIILVLAGLICIVIGQIRGRQQ